MPDLPGEFLAKLAALRAARAARDTLAPQTLGPGLAIRLRRRAVPEADWPDPDR